MSLVLANYEAKAREAIMAFWGNREKALQKQTELGKIDAGTRGSVTAGKNMDGFVTLIAELIRANGLAHAGIHLSGRPRTLPGYFRATKDWDLIVTLDNRLVAAIELKSQVGSFGNNFNNRTEEAIGTAHDLWTAYREDAFGKNPRPFLGWLILVEDAEASRKPIKDLDLPFPVFPEFRGKSYLERYDILCQRLVKEQLYSVASVIASPADAAVTGAFRDLSDMTSLKTFVTSLAGHIAAEAARTQG